MNKITFVNGQEPAVNANNLNLIQTNAENAIATAKTEAINSASADATSKDNNVLSTLRGEISTAQSNAIGTASTNTTNAINAKIQYGTSLPSSANNGTIFLLYS